MEDKLLENERIDDLQINNLKIIQKKDGFCFGLDSVLIANYVKVSKNESTVMDLGTGTGIISILLAGKNDSIDKIYGIDIQEDMIEMAKRSVKMNNLDDKIEMINADICGISSNVFKKKFDIVVTNPPYKKSNTGLTNLNEKKLISRHEVKCKLEDVIYESSKLLKDNGLFYMVHRPDRLEDIMVCMRENKVEPKEIQFVYPHINDDANLLLIKGVKCGRPYLKILKPLIVYDDNSNYTEDILKMYGKG